MIGNHNTASLILELITTIGEGLGYLQDQLQQGRLAENHYLLKDIHDARPVVDRASAGLPAPPETASEIVAASEELLRCLQELDRAYAQNEVEKARFEMQVTVGPAFKRWEELLRSIMNPVAQS